MARQFGSSTSGPGNLGIRPARDIGYFGFHGKPGNPTARPGNKPVNMANGGTVPGKPAASKQRSEEVYQSPPKGKFDLATQGQPKSNDHSKPGVRRS